MQTIQYKRSIGILRLLLLTSAVAASVSAQSLTVLNAASFTGASVAPGSIVTILGSNLTTGTATVTDPARPPSTLGGVQVVIGGIPAALFYVSPNQINAVVGTATPVGANTVTVTSGSGTSTGSIFVDNNAAPGLFSLSGTGTHDGAIVDALTGRIGAVKATTPVSTTFLSIYLTGANFAASPVVTVAGVTVPVTFAGASPCCAGLQQINISIPAALAGAGRVPVTVRTGTAISNVVEIVLLPAKGNGEFEEETDDQDRSRELSAIAYIPGSSFALVADENDDVVRELDLLQKKVVRVLSLASNAEPSSIAVNAAGTLAVVAERGRAKVAIINLSTFAVAAEIAVGAGPVSIAISGNLAVVVNGDSNSVTVVDFVAKTVVATIPVGLGARSVAIGAANLAYVTNESAGTISVIDLGTAKVINTINLGAARPAAIQIIAGTPYAVVTDPATADNGKVLVVNTSTGLITAFEVNADRSGGSNDLVLVGSKAYIANQSGGSISILPLSISGSTVSGAATTLKVGSGVRALALDTKDNLLLAVNESTGEVVLISLSSSQMVGRFPAVTGGSGRDGDDHSDHDNSTNSPVITGILPVTAKLNSTLTLTIKGTNLQGASELVFVVPSMFPGKSEDHGKGRGLVNQAKDAAITAANIQVNAAGTQLTATVTVSPLAVTGIHVVFVSTPNGESSFAQSVGNTFTIMR
jgi:uncharacterized protein (TIGR03437 family)